MITKEEFVEYANDVLKHYDNNTKEKNYDDIVCWRFLIVLLGTQIAVWIAGFFLDVVQWGVFFFISIFISFVLLFFIVVLPYQKHKKIGFIRKNKALEKILYDWNMKFTFSNTIINEYKKDLVNDGYVYMIDGDEPFYVQEGCNDFECFTRFYWKYNHKVDKNEIAQKIESITKLFHVTKKKCELTVKKEKIFVDVNGFRLSCFLTGVERPKAITEEQELESLYDNLKALQKLANGIDDVYDSK